MESDPFTLGDQSNDNNNCNLVGTSGLAVQIILILLIFVAVKSMMESDLVKHHFERPRRRMLLFFMDGAKQLSSNGMIHVVNVAISVKVGDDSSHDQCGTYFASLIIDVTLGLFVTYYLLVVANHVLSKGLTSV